MRKPNPDPHPERADVMDDISPERIIWRQIDRCAESAWRHDEFGMHGSVSILSAMLASMKGDGWETEMASVAGENGFEERFVRQFESLIRLLDSKGKWVKESKRDVEPGKEWREAFQ